MIEKLGSAVQGYEGQRVIAGAITPAGTAACLCGCHSQDGASASTASRRWAAGASATRSTACQAEYVLVPDAMANLAPMPDELTDEQVLMCPDIMSTGFSGAERGKVRIGDTVAVFAQGPIGLCATAGAGSGAPRRSSAWTPSRREWRWRGNGRRHHAWTSGRSIRSTRSCGSPTDAASTWRSRRWGRSRHSSAALRVLRPGGTLSSLGVYSGDLRIPLGPFAAGLGDLTIVTTLCPGGKERMRRLVSMVRPGAWTSGRWSRTASSWTISRRPTTSSAISATGC